jgi:hypothetical protein
MAAIGAKAYTHLVLATEMRKFFAGTISEAEAVRRALPPEGSPEGWLELLVYECI